MYTNIFKIKETRTEWPHWVIPPACNAMMFKLWNIGILASYLWKMNGYGVMSRRQHPISKIN